MRIYQMLSFLLPILLLPAEGQGAGHVFHKRVETAERNMAVELVSDNVVHFQMGTEKLPERILRSPMVVDDAEEQLGRATAAQLHTGGVEGRTLSLEVAPDGQCLVVKMARKNEVLARICQRPKGHLGLTLTIDALDTSHLYGLGEQFEAPGVTDGDWMGKWRAGGPFGNDMVTFSGGMVGNAQFPVLYLLGPGKKTYAIIIDEARRVSWDMTQKPFLVSSPTDTLRGYVIVGNDLPDVRAQVMTLVGKPLVPPKSAFGMWMSKYGYRSWEEVGKEVETLQRAHFPVDGAVLDLFWFGGVDSGGPKTKIGTLQWDPEHFGDPKGHITALKQKLGIDLMVIEESYVGEHLPEFDALSRQGELAVLCGSKTPAPVVNDSTIYDRPNPRKDAWFWGTGGMLDWTQKKTRAHWHNNKRQPLLDAGVVGFWTDLGEPRMFNNESCYAGGIGSMPAPAKHVDVHNLYSLLWHRGIYEGMTSKHRAEDLRPFMLSRSGTLGIARYGAAMWSGDIGSNLASLAAHMNAQMHLSLSGVDYFGTDVGGFWRSGFDGDDVGAMFSTWLANSALLDVPLRPHTMDTQNIRTTNPALLGDVEGNRRALQLRYSLVPYLYSEAHRAFDTGEALFAPLVYRFQEDPETRALGSQKMVGRDLMVGTVTQYDETSRDIYLPRGDWYDWYTGRKMRSEGAWHRGVSTVAEGHVRLPLYARAGSMIPLAPLGAQGAFEPRNTHEQVSTLRVRIFASDGPGEGTVIEDDGSTMGYQFGQRRITRLALAPRPHGAVELSVQPSEGEFKGARQKRGLHLEYVGAEAFQTVRLDGKILAQDASGRKQVGVDNFWRRRQDTVEISVAPRATRRGARVVLEGVRAR